MANELDITMDQGSSLDYTFNLRNQDGTPFDLSGYDARMQVRKTYGAVSPVISCTLANSKIIISAPLTGKIEIALLPSDTSLIRFNAVDDATLECVYDIELQSSTGFVFKPSSGNFTINREVTR